MDSDDRVSKIKERVLKLLALSKSDNESEALAALQKANELIEKYGLDEESIGFKQVEVPSTKTAVPWRSMVANAVSWLYGCYHFRYSNSGEMVFAGEDLYAFMAGEMFTYLVKAIERTAKQSIRKNAKYAFRQSFKQGMASRLYDRIYELGRACSWAPQREANIETARELVKKEPGTTWENSVPRKVKLNYQAYSRDFAAANDVSLARQVKTEAPKSALPAPRRTMSQKELF